MEQLSHQPSPIPLGLYVHMPWCVRKCPYCDFNSHTRRTAIPESKYVDTLLADLQEERRLIDTNREVTSIFFGGGTPSLFSAVEIGRFLYNVRDVFPLAEDVEITLETNPGTVEHDTFESYYQAGINRISLGVQSFDDALLDAIGRIHSGVCAKTALAQAQSSGFEQINVDLMFALPDQTLAKAQRDLMQVCETGVTHVSWYQLTLEPGTPFYEKPPPMPDPEQAWAIQEAGAKVLARAGLGQYEVSAFSKPGARCRHNLNYWQYGDYIGIGAGAHGKLTGADGVVRRREKVRHPNQYMNSPNSPLAHEHIVTPDDQMFEFMLNQLRLKDGVSRSQFEKRTQSSLDILEKKIQPLLERGLMETIARGWVTTSLGYRFLNDLQSAFLPNKVEPLV